MADKQEQEAEIMAESFGDKSEAIKAVLKQMDKTYGKGTLMRLGDATAKMQVEVIPTGILPIDVILGVGGLPRGRIVEIYGPESSGKTTLTLHMIAQAQKLGGLAAFIDAEHALDPIYAKRLGVDIDNLLVSQPDSGEQALEIVEALVRSMAIDLVVVDSVAALVPQAELEGDMGDTHMGLIARLMSQAMRKLTGALSKSNATAIFINQIRDKIGTYGGGETTTGGRALKFYSSVRIDVRKGEPIKKGTDIIGNETKIKVVKNKVAPPFRNCLVDILYGEGISKESTIIDVAAELDIIQKSGSWYAYNGERIGQGKDTVKDKLREEPAFYDEIEAKVKEQLEDPEVLEKLTRSQKKK